LKIYRVRRYRRYQMEEYRTRRSRRYRKKRLRGRRLISVITLILVIAGLGLVGYALLGGEDALLPRAVSSASKGEELATSAPKDTTLKMTIPKMARVEDLPVYNAAWDDETALDVSASHLDSTGFPWQDGSNVYISGHRMGFPGTRSFLVFYDLDVLENGDEVYLTDSNGAKYSYKVFSKYVADPYDWSPTEPVTGKNVVTLQTCTLPDYTQRLIVQAELTETTPGDSSSKAEPTETTPGDSPSKAEPTETTTGGLSFPDGPGQYVEPEPVESGQYLGPTQEAGPGQYAEPVGPEQAEPVQGAGPEQYVEPALVEPA
jgi:sortase A